MTLPDAHALPEPQARSGPYSSFDLPDLPDLFALPDAHALPDGTGDRVLIAGVGNVFLGDDGFGVEVVRRIEAVDLPSNVDVTDYGIRGVHLAYELLNGRHHTLIVVDAMPVEGPPGTLAVLEVGDDEPVEDTEPAEDGQAPVGPAGVVDGHGMDPQAVLSLLADLGGRVDRVLVVGCRPAVIDERMELSEPVRAVVNDAARLAVELALEAAPPTDPTAPACAERPTPAGTEQTSA